MTVAAGVALAAPAQAASPTVTVGATSDGGALQKATGVPMAVHTYTHFSSKVPSGAAMITVSASAPWRTVAQAGPGSALYADIVRWADTIKARPGTVLLAYHHEPEAHASSGLGSASDFIAAYRHVWSIFQSQGVTNVRWVWQMTSYAFHAPPGDRRFAAKWYPGDQYVDVVGADGFNWGSCYGHDGRTFSLAAIAAPVLTFARSHGKQVSLPEWASVGGAARAQWLRDAHSYVSANRNTLTSLFYFNIEPGVAASGCDWRLRTQAEFDAYRAMATDPNLTR